MRRILIALFALALFVGFASVVHAQSSAQPGFPTIVRNTVPTPIGKSGIIGSISDGYGNPVKGAELVVSILRFDSEYRQYVDLGSTKRYSQCTSAGATDCVQVNGQYNIQLSSLPSDGPNSYWWWLEIRVEAPGGMIQGSWDARRIQIQANGRPEYIAPIYLYDYGFKIDMPMMYWINQDIVAVGMWIRSYGTRDVSVGFAFEGSALTKTSVKYAQVNSSQRIDEGWTYSETWFYAPKAAYYKYGSSFCGEVQITLPDMQEWVLDSTKKVCVAAKP